MTKPKEKTREELQAEIEDGKKKIRQFENREKRRLHGKPCAGAYCHAGRGCADLFPTCFDE